ncbi:MAG TPA: hypothetical protein VIL83_03990 [Capillibacterium sp.]
MSKKHRWLKISGSVLVVVLFFLIINSFFRENIRLLNEGNTWRERAEELEARERALQTEKEKLEHILMPEGSGLVITGLRWTELAFENGHRLSYELALTVDNRSERSLPAGKAHLILAFAPAGTSTFQRISGQEVALPPLQAGEEKTIAIPGAIPASPGEEMLCIVSLNEQPGVAKLQVSLVDSTARHNFSPQ